MKRGPAVSGIPAAGSMLPESSKLLLIVFVGARGISGLIEAS